jgi:hypothetical protein
MNSGLNTHMFIGQVNSKSWCFCLHRCIAISILVLLFDQLHKHHMKNITPFQIKFEN